MHRALMSENSYHAGYKGQILANLPELLLYADIFFELFLIYYMEIGLQRGLCYFYFPYTL
jgi:hypothetical protein